jgi:Flp pilus assembly protein TadD
MPPIVKKILVIAAVIIILIIGYQAHWAVGLVLSLALLGYGMYAGRAALYAQKGNLAFMRGNQKQALALMEKAYKTKRVQPQHAIGYAFVLMKEGQPAKAEGILKELLSSTKDGKIRMQIKMNLATAYWLQDQQDEAVALLEELHVQFKNTILYGNLGYFKLLCGQLEEALVLNEEAYEYNAADVTIIDNLAQTYLFHGRLEEAEALYVKLMVKSPKYAESYYYYALTLQKLDKLDTAREQIAIAQGKPASLVTVLTKAQIDELAAQLAN